MTDTFDELFDQEIADDLLLWLERRTEANSESGWLHALVAAVALCPNSALTHAAVDYIHAAPQSEIGL